MKTKIKLKQLIVDKVINTRLLKIIKVPGEPVKEILNSINKIEIQGVSLKESKIVIDFKLSLHIIYIPQGIGEFKQTFSVSFNFLQELDLDLKGDKIWPRIMANIGQLVIKTQNKNLMVLFKIATNVLVMDLKEYRISEVKSLKNPVTVAAEDIKTIDVLAISKVLKLELADESPWQVAEVYPEGLNYSYEVKDGRIEFALAILARMIVFRESNPKPKVKYQLVECSVIKTVEGWESQGGLSIEPQFYQLNIIEKKSDQLVLDFNAVFTMARIKIELLEVSLKDIGEVNTHLLLEKPVLCFRETLKLEKDLTLVDSVGLEVKPEVFVWFDKKDCRLIQGVVCLKIYTNDPPKGKSLKGIEYIPFSVESNNLQKHNLILTVQGRAKIEKLEQIQQQKVRCYLLVILDLKGSEIITASLRENQ